MENSTVSPYLGKTLTKVIGAQYAYEKAVNLRKSLPKLDLESREICGDILNELESYSIDMQDEYWLDFNNAIRTKLEEFILHLNSIYRDQFARNSRLFDRDTEQDYVSPDEHLASSATVDLEEE